MVRSGELTANHLGLRESQRCQGSTWNFNPYSTEVKKLGIKASIYGLLSTFTFKNRLN